MEKSLLILRGKVDPTSPLGCQLGLESAFNLRLRAITYRDWLAGNLAQIEQDFDLLWDEELGPKTKVREIAAHLTARGVEWRTYRNIAIYSVELYAFDPKSLCLILTKMALADDPTLVTTDPLFCSMPMTLLESTQYQERELWNMPGPLKIEMDLERHFANISKSTGLLEISRAFTQPRHFNEVIRAGAYCIKRSRNTDKIQSEHAFLSSIPKEIKPYFPVVGELRKTSQTAEYEVEFMPFFDASCLLVHASVPPSDFSSLLDAVEEYRSRCPVLQVSAEQFRQSMRKLFVEKLSSRVNQFLADPTMAKVLQYTEAIVQGGLPELVRSLIERLEEKLRSTSCDKLYFSHGDLCLSNILYDRQNQRIKLIDPRGIQRAEDAFLPEYYDIAKLSHSFLGKYDLIVKELTYLTLNETLDIDLNCAVPPAYLKDVERIFHSYLESTGLDYELVRLCEASLFLSMLPLHRDRPNHIIQQILAGIRCMRESIPTSLPKIGRISDVTWDGLRSLRGRSGKKVL